MLRHIMRHESNRRRVTAFFVCIDHLHRGVQGKEGSDLHSHNSHWRRNTRLQPARFGSCCFYPFWFFSPYTTVRAPLYNYQYIEFSFFLFFSVLHCWEASIWGRVYISVEWAVKTMCLHPSTYMGAKVVRRGGDAWRLDERRCPGKSARGDEEAVLDIDL